MASLKDVLAKAEEARGRGKRSQLYLWMRKNYDGLNNRIRSGELTWDGLTAAIVSAGLTDAEGKLPTKKRCQNTFYVLRREKELARGKTASPGPTKGTVRQKREELPPSPKPGPSKPTGLLEPRRPPRPME